MKPTIAAALASWILLAPPMDLGWGEKIDPSAPLSQWSVVNTYDTALECDLVRYGRIAGAMRALDRPGDMVEHRRRRRLLIWAYLWECAASDDPQLRPAN